MQGFELDYQKYHYEIYVFLYGMLHSQAEAQEILQETFLAYLQELRKDFMPAVKKRRWLYKVARNKAINVIKRDNFRKGIEENELVHTVQTQQSSNEHEGLMQIRGLMGQLTQREALILQLYCSGLSYDEMAEVMDLEKASVGKTLGRAKKSFKQLYDAQQSAFA